MATKNVLFYLPIPLWNKFSKHIIYSQTFVKLLRDFEVRSTLKFHYFCRLQIQISYEHDDWNRICGHVTFWVSLRNGFCQNSRLSTWLYRMKWLNIYRLDLCTETGIDMHNIFSTHVFMHVRLIFIAFCLSVHPGLWDIPCAPLNPIAHEQKYLRFCMNGVFIDPSVMSSTNWQGKKDWESIKKILTISSFWGLQRPHSCGIESNGTKKHIPGSVQLHSAFFCERLNKVTCTDGCAHLNVKLLYFFLPKKSHERNHQFSHFFQNLYDLLLDMLESLSYCTDWGFLCYEILERCSVLL